jgi:hypothetical protein
MTRQGYGWMSFDINKAMLPLWLVIITVFTWVQLLPAGPTQTGGLRDLITHNPVQFGIYGLLILLGIVAQCIIVYNKVDKAKLRFETALRKWARAYLYLLLLCSRIINQRYTYSSPLAHIPIHGWWK